MSPHVSTPAPAVLSGPALRLHLLELLVANFDAMDGSDVVATAREAYEFIVGEAPASVAPEPEPAPEAEALEPLPELPVTSPPIEPPTATTMLVMGRAVSLWTSARISRLEQLLAAGLPYAEISTSLGTSPSAISGQASLRGFTAKYPRTTRGKLLYEPYPLDAPWPPRKGVIVGKRVAQPEPEEDVRPTSDRDERRERKCLHCGKMFPSESAGNRICPKCKPTVAAAYEPVSAKVSA